MARGGLRSSLKPILYFGIAATAHALLFLIPGGMQKPAPGMLRGVRVHSYVENPAAVRARPVSAPVVPPVVVPASRPDTPPVVVGPEKTGGGTPGGVDMTYRSGEPHGEDTGGKVGDSARSAATISPFGDYMNRLRSKEVQGWARDASRKSRSEWRGDGLRPGGWGGGTGGGRPGAPSQGGGSAYMDPRVRMVVTSYPSTGIEKKFTAVPYPEFKVKRAQYSSGWWNVYLEIFTDANGKIKKIDVLRPETRGELEKLFLDQVNREVSRWTFDPVAAEIHVDVRFYVE